MQDEDLKLIRQIVASGGRKYTAGNVNRSRYDRLVDMGWLTAIKMNDSDVEYHVTDRGRAVAVARQFWFGKMEDLRLCQDRTEGEGDMIQ